MLRSPFRETDKENLSLYDLFQRITKGEYPPINDRYSQDLRDLIKNMLKISPEERFGIDQICDLCSAYKANIASKPSIDTYLIMDDIIEKLSLLDYEN
jgi:NIMA (never in mitosis gene a)-related kinase